MVEVVESTESGCGILWNQVESWWGNVCVIILSLTLLLPNPSELPSLVRVAPIETQGICFTYG